MIKKTLSLPSYFLMIMKWTTIVYTVISFCLLTAKASETHGQINFDSKLVLKEETLSLRASLKKISKQTGVNFAYNSRSLPLNKSIQWSAGQADLKQVMDHLGEVLGLNYQAVGNSLVLVAQQSNTPEPRPAKHVDIRQYEDPETKEQVIEGRVFDAETNEPLVGATVELVNFKTRTRTDKNGHFRMVIPKS